MKRSILHCTDSPDTRSFVPDTRQNARQTHDTTASDLTATDNVRVRAHLLAVPHHGTHASSSAAKEVVGRRVGEWGDVRAQGAHTGGDGAARVVDTARQGITHAEQAVANAVAALGVAGARLSEVRVRRLQASA